MINSLLEDRRDNLVVMATGKLPLHPKKQQKVVPFLGESSKTNMTCFFGLTKGLESSVVAAEKAQCLTSAFFSPLRLWKKLMLPISSCLHWTHRSCHLPSHLPDGGPGAAVDVSNVAAAAGCCSAPRGLTRVLPAAVLGVPRCSLVYSRLFVCQLQSTCFSRNTRGLCQQSQIPGFATQVNQRLRLQRMDAGERFLKALISGFTGLFVSRPK